MILLVIIGFFFFFVCIFWLIGFFIRNDFSVPSTDIHKFGNILVIFPHPDDEVLTTGGLLHQASIHGANTTLHILTKGECGTPDAHEDLKLKSIRSDEAKIVSQILGIQKLIHDDFGDGQLIKKRAALTKRVNEVIMQVKPDVIITYDLSGLYGHNDHITLAEVITDLVQKKYPRLHLWYATNPKRILKFISLPEHMATDPEFRKKRILPTTKIWKGLSTIKEIKALYAYRSQFTSFKGSFPLNYIPVWFLLSMSWYNYFYEVNE